MSARETRPASARAGAGRRDGFLFARTDFEGLELRVMAQVASGDAVLDAVPGDLGRNYGSSPTGRRSRRP